MAEPEAPSWLTVEFLSEFLPPNTFDKVRVSSAVPKGNNYTSNILRLTIDNKDGSTTSLIIKAKKTDGLSEVVEEMGMHQKEVDVYTTLIPKLSQLYGENVFTPKIYRSSKPDLLIFGDLNVEGYKMADRLKQLDYDHAVAAIKAVARFHAATIKCYDVEPKVIERLATDPLINPTVRRNNPHFVTHYFLAAAEEMAKTPETAKYSAKLLEYEKTCWDILLNLFNPCKSNFNVLNHGDLWTANMLFKYDRNSKPVDVRLIDFQMSKYCSPVVDIIYLLAGSVQQEVVKTRLDGLLSGYLNELNNTIRHCGSSRRLKMDELKKAIDKFRFYELFVTFQLLPMTLLDQDEIIDTNEITEADLASPELTFMKKIFNGSLFKQILPKRLEDLEQKGIL